MSLHSLLRGDDLHAPSNELVEQSTGSTITKLSVVSLSGMGAVYPNIILANPSARQNFGIAIADILTGEAGIITAIGFMFNVDTSAWTQNTLLYSDISGQLSTTILGSPVAIVIKQDALFGVLYVTTLTDISGISVGNEWGLLGNAGTDPNTNFIGTRDSQPVKFRTNNLPVGQFDSNGRLAIGAHSPRAILDIKPYPGYSDSGLRIEPFAVTSSVNTPAQAYAIVMSNNQIVRVKFTVTCRQSDGTARAAFTRSALFYKEGGNVQIQGPTGQSDLTIKSNNGFNVTFTAGVSTILFNVKNANNVDTYWSGHMEMEFVSSNI
jgi:hypothetical protein